MCGNWVKDVLGWEVRERKNDDRSIGNDNIRGGETMDVKLRRMCMWGI